MRIISKFAVTFSLVSAFSFASCLSDGKDQPAATYAEKLIRETENDQSLVGRYHPVQDERNPDRDWGSIYVYSVEGGAQDSVQCMQYEYATRTNSGSFRQELCITNK